jgi:transposase
VTDDEIRAVYGLGPGAVIALVRQLLGQIADLAARVKALEDRLARDSHNSSKPPSTDQPGSRPKPKSLRQKSGRKPGGQPGHPGRTLTVSQTPDRVVTHSPKQCAKCQESLESAPVVAVEKRQVVELPPIRIEVIEHQAESRQCRCGHVTQASFPEGVGGNVQYGPDLKAVAVYLNQEQLLPTERTTEVMVEVFGCESFSQATLGEAVAECHEHLASVEAVIKAGVQKAPVAHFDETGLNVEAKLNWLHVASTPDLTHYGWHAQRGPEGANAIGILPGFRGIGVHDGLETYWGYPWDHALCNGHHLRELTFIEEQLGQPWAGELAKLLREIKQAVAGVRERGETRLPPDQELGFNERYTAILAAGFAMNPPPERPPRTRGRPKRGKVLSLLDRLSDHRDAVLRFMTNFRVPFDNNQAERDIRMTKVKQKISGCFRKPSGASEFCRIRSYTSTARKWGLRPLTCIRKALVGSPWAPLMLTLPTVLPSNAV